MEDRALNDLDAEIEQMEQALTSTPTEPTSEATEVKPPEPTADAVIVQNLKRDLDIAQKRYNNFKASTDITIRDSRNELQTLRSQVSNLQSEIAKLKASATPSKDVSSYFSQEDREILGETAVEALDKSVKEIVDAKVNPLQEQLDKERAEKAEIQKQEAQKNVQRAQVVFTSKLKSIVPDYQAILDKQEFYTWIDDVDPVSGYTRKALFTNAEKEGDVVRVASFFNEFRALTTSKRSALEENVVPAGVGGNPPVVNKENKTSPINEQFIDKFYDDLSKGDIKYKGKKGRELAEKVEGQIDRWVQDQFRR